MKHLGRWAAVSLSLLLFLWTAMAQGQQRDPVMEPREQNEYRVSPAQGLQATMPRLVRVSSSVKDSSGRPLRGAVGITFALYEDPEEGAPLWMENQSVELDDQGRYAVLLGATEPDGLPLELFTTGRAQWLGIQVQGEPEQPRVLLVPVPYALKAADAETLGGRPPSAYVQVDRETSLRRSRSWDAGGDGDDPTGAAPADKGSSDKPASGASTSSALGGDHGGTPAAIEGSGTANYLAKFSDSSNITSSSIFESGGDVNISPSGNIVFGGSGSGAKAHFKNAGSFAVRYENTSGSIFSFLVDTPLNTWQLTTGLPNNTLITAHKDGNVGIGTTTPARKLEVAGNLRLSAGASIDTPSGDLNINPPGNVVFGGTGSGAKVHFKSSGSFAVRYQNLSGSIFNFTVDNPLNTLQLTSGAENTSILTAKTDGTITFSRTPTFNAGIDVDGSSLFVDSANHRVGVGTATPGQKLEVAGNLRLSAGATIDTASGDLNINPPGNIVFGGSGSGAKVHFKNFGSFAVRFQNTAGGGSLFSYVVDNPSGTFQLTRGMANSPVITAKSDGSVGIGTANPAATLHVAGDVVADGNLAATYQDVAEWVFADRAIPAGTVVVIDKDRSNWVLPSRQPYDASVVGVVSAAPGLLLGVAGEGKVKVAATGRVKVKVDATRAPIRAGDLLVTSGKEGIAMRSEPVDVAGVKMHRPGTLIGKALEPLPSGEGEILVVLGLQ